VSSGVGLALARVGRTNLHIGASLVKDRSPGVARVAAAEGLAACTARAVLSFSAEVLASSLALSTLSVPSGGG
jgi:hypothetical protein